MVSSIPAPLPIDQQVVAAHETIKKEFPGIERLALALYDRKTDQLKTFVSSTDGGNPLDHYQARLADVPSLKALAETGGFRVVDRLSQYGDASSLHTAVLRERYESSFTQPIFEGSKLRGFLFLDARAPGFFTEAIVERVKVYADLVTLVFLSSLYPLRILSSAVQVASQVTHTRDPETGAHLERMARYAHLIGREMAKQGKLTDAFVEYLRLFAPLHDVGKIGIPDHVLLKKGPLTDEEFAIMKTHSAKGLEMIDRVLEDVGAAALPFVEMLRNIVHHHHEAWDGSGYPRGLAGTAIPVEARIVAVADVYDALTSERPYKRAWSPEEAVDYLKRSAGERFDPECVELLIANMDEVEDIRRKFQDAPSTSSREGYTQDL